MKYILNLIFILTLCNFIFAQPSVLTCGIYTGPTMFTEDPNLNKHWDWEKGDVLRGGVPRYYIFLQNRPNSVEEYEAILPWYQQSSWAGLEDRKKEDGWILLARDFGSPNRRLIGTNPYFVIYNKYRSIIRVFILLLNVPTTFTYSTIELKSWHKGSGLLAHLAPLAYAMDSVKKTYNNATSVTVNSLASNNYWVYADFPLAYDNTLLPTENTEIPPSLIFDVYGTTLSNINLETVGFGAQGDQKYINDFLAKNQFGSPGFSLNRGALPNLDIPFNLPDVSLKATAPNWDKMKDFFGNLKIDLNLENINISPLYKDLIDAFSSSLSLCSIASPISLTGLNLGSIFQFFISGGLRKQNVDQTAPTFIATHYSATGTMTTTNRFASMTVPVPSSRKNFKEPFNGGEVGIVQNSPVGLFTLKNTPTVFKKKYTFPIVISGTTIQPHNPAGEMIEYELSAPPQILINENADLKLLKCEISLVAPLITKPRSIFDKPTTYEFIKNFSEIERITRNAKNTNNQNILIEFESPINGGSGYFRSLPVPLELSKGRTLQLPQNLSVFDVKLFVKAILLRKHDPTAQPVVFIANYEVNVVERNDLESEKALPTIPPQNVICSFTSSSGVNVSWDRNLEKNIKYYAVERSINGGKYTLIGSTSDTVYIDTEIQKAVKTYQSYVSNVNVYYRVRALSEWKDESNITRSQFSNYSSVAYAYGSYNYGPMDKRQEFASAPESNDLSQNFPNPFNPTTTIYYAVKDAGNVMIKIFNSLGQEIQTLVDEQKDAGYHYVEWNATGYPSGVYFYRITNGSYVETKRMILTK